MFACDGERCVPALSIFVIIVGIGVLKFLNTVNANISQYPWRSPILLEKRDGLFLGFGFNGSYSTKI